MKLLRTGSRACLLGSAFLFGAPVITQAAVPHKTHIVQNTGHHRAAPIHTRENLREHAIHPINAHTTAHLTEPRHVVYRHTTGTHAVTTHNVVAHPAKVHTVAARGKVLNDSTAEHGRLVRPIGVAHSRIQTRHGKWGISCVPYAREVSGITVAGNAWQWWNNAAGLYARGNRPEPGSVLNFRANGRMPLGHVAVVTKIVNAREIKVEQANWPTAGGYGGISHDVAVVDVSEANNWSAVRVEIGHDGTFGSVYPTYGFIYNRPDTGYVMASATHPASIPNINPAPSDLRPAAERPWHTFEEVAEAPAIHTPAPRHIAAHRHVVPHKTRQVRHSHR